MSSQQFIETLHQIGYPKADSLSAKTIDWIFEDEAALPFLSWFCSTVRQQNVITEDEKQRFTELEESGETILEGAVLDEALHCLSSNEKELFSVESLREQIDKMKDDVQRLRERKEKMVKTRNTLSLHHTGLVHRLAKCGDVESAKRQAYNKSLEKCHKANAESGACLRRLGDSVQMLCSLYDDQGQSEKTDTKESEGVFLSHLSLDAFHQMEENYSKELTHFTKKLFFEGIADIAGGELSRYQLLETSNPTSLLVKGQSHKAFNQDCQELNRLQTLFPKSEGERINALVEAKCAASISAAAEDILRKLEDGHFPSDLKEINRQVQEVNSALSVVRDELKKLTEGEVGPLVRELGTLQGTRVLTGDYRLKLARQDYFIGNQEQVIKYLVNQRARNEFLTMAFEIEGRNHRDVHRLLTAMQKTLHKRLTDFKERMEAMDDPALTSAKYDRGTIDTGDVASTCLHHMLVSREESEKQQLFLSFNSMVQAAELLKQTHAKSKADAAFTLDKYQDKVQKLETEVKSCEETLYAESSTVGGQPVLMPRELMETTTQLDDMLHKLEAAILKAVTDVNSKKKTLKMDILQTKERELFTLFHLHPERLKQTIESLEKRLQAHSVS